MPQDWLSIRKRFVRIGYTLPDDDLTLIWMVVTLREPLAPPDSACIAEFHDELLWLSPTH